MNQQEYGMKIADALAKAAFDAGHPIIGVDIAEIVASVSVLTTDQKMVNAQNLLIKSQERQLSDFRKKSDEWREAFETLDSECGANELLTQLLEQRTRERDELSKLLADTRAKMSEVNKLIISAVAADNAKVKGEQQ